jgi:hypothetical protein
VEEDQRIKIDKNIVESYNTVWMKMLIPEGLGSQSAPCS